MNRVELKEKAKAKIKGNLWTLWKPMVMFALAVFAVTFIVVFCVAMFGTDDNILEIITEIIAGIAGVVETVFMFGYAKYTLDFVRDKEINWKQPFSYIKDHWLSSLLFSIVVALCAIAGTILLVIPGIIIGIGLTFYQEVYADNDTLSIKELLKKSWEMTKGYKADLFVLMLSFIGWILLAPFTLGILLIWLIPYVTITLVYAYETLKK